MPRFVDASERPEAPEAAGPSAIAKYAYGDWSSDVKVSTDVRRALKLWRDRRRAVRGRDDPAPPPGPPERERGDDLEPRHAAPLDPRTRSVDDTMEVIADELFVEPEASPGASATPRSAQIGRLLLVLFILLTALGVVYGLLTLS